MREALERRLPDEDADHAKLQLERLRLAMRVATGALAEGDVAAIAPYLKVLDRLDRYQKTAKVNQVYDDGARKKLFEKLNRVAANLGLTVIEDPAKAKAIRRRRVRRAIATPEPAGAEGATEGRTGRKRKNALGGRRKPLKRLDPDKRIQGNPRPFPLMDLGPAWPSFAGFGWIWFWPWIADEGAVGGQR